MQGADVNLVLIFAISIAVAFMLWFLVNLVRDARRRRKQGWTRDRHHTGIWE
jgi:uncharacterized membrane protein SpoIIM required for sporulation